MPRSPRRKPRRKRRIDADLTITIGNLRSRHVCRYAKRDFEAAFGKSTKLSPAAISKLSKPVKDYVGRSGWGGTHANYLRFSYFWLLRHLFPLQQRDYQRHGLTNMPEMQEMRDYQGQGRNWHQCWNKARKIVNKARNTPGHPIYGTNTFTEAYRKAHANAYET